MQFVDVSGQSMIESAMMGPMSSLLPDRRRVLCVGDANPDLVLRGDVVPRFGQREQIIESADLVIGGSAGITAHGFARLNRPVSLVAAVGGDVFGAELRERLRRAGVDVSPLVTRADTATGLSVILYPAADRGATGDTENAPDDRAILTEVGAIPTLTAAEVLAAARRTMPMGLAHVHFASLFLQPHLHAELPNLLAELKAMGLTTSLDTNDDPAGRWSGIAPLLPHLDHLLPNASETLALAAALGRTPARAELDAAGEDREFDLGGAKETEAIVHAAIALAHHGPRVTVKAGRHGALSVAIGDPATDAEIVHVAAVAAQVLDTTGAGDTFDAAFIDTWLDERSVRECLRRAVAAGACAVSAIGGTAGQPRREDLDQPSGT
jgi:sugar/nucleoside kinase (ribokinase family)